MLRFILVWVICSFLSMGYATQSVRPLPVDKAFMLTAVVNKDSELSLVWTIAPGYYLYREKMDMSAAPGNQVPLGKVNLPKGEARHDVLHGNFQAYVKTVAVAVPLHGLKGQLNMSINYQGCSSNGFCYTPVKKALAISLTGLTLPQDISYAVNSTKPALEPVPISNQGYAAQLLSGHHYFLIVLGFLALGLLLAFTPCVLPMVPILSSIIVGYGNKLSTKKAFSLSLAYVLGMAIAYASAGMVVALLGSRIQIAMQQTWIIVLLSGLFILLALSLFGFYDIRLPNALQQRLAATGNKLKGGTYISVFVMGVVSTLIVSPCVSAPLVGVLAYIANSGDVLLGGIALLALGIGMGIPLLLLGASAGKWLPKAGKWMDVIKHIFGLMMLALAIWMLERVLPGAAVLFLWSILVIVTGLYIRQLKRSKRIWHHLHHGFGFAMLVYGFILLAGAIIGQSDPLYLFQSNNLLVAQNKTTFTVVKSMAELDQRLAEAKSHKQQVMLDFYADWCASCVVMDRTLFVKPEIKTALSKFILLRADVTKDNAFDQAMLQRFQVVAPPTMIFFDEEGRTMLKHEIVGEVEIDQFLTDIHQVYTDQKF
jgi:thiol:disulfide interchange protein DsbD